jgi:hypothetical protein
MAKGYKRPWPLPPRTAQGLREGADYAELLRDLDRWYWPLAVVLVVALVLLIAIALVS